MKMQRNLFVILMLILPFSALSVWAQKNAPATKTEPKAASKTAALPTVDEILDKYVQALGGEAALKKATSYYMRGTAEIPAAGIKGTFEAFHKAPNKVAASMNIPGFGEIVEVFDGERVWSSDPVQGVREKTGEELEKAKLDFDFYRNTNLKTAYSKRELQGIEKIEGADAYKVLLATDKISETWYFDVKTGLVVRTDDILFSNEGKMPIKTFLSDYRSVDGLMMPFMTRLETPVVGIALKAAEIKMNVAIEDSKFAKPAAK